MNLRSIVLLPILSSVVLPYAAAQTAAPAIAASALTAVPPLVPYSGQVSGRSGQASATFSIYKDQQGGEALFTESQMISFDHDGYYTVQLGAANPNGLPAALFASGEARWLEVQVAGEAAHPRVLLASVPYALKAADATTLGGLPASAFVLAGSRNLTNLAASNEAAAIVPDAASTVTTTGGTSGYLPQFSGKSTIVDSILFSTATGIGVGDVPNSSAVFDVNGKSIWRGLLNVSRAGTATSSAGYPSFGMFFQASAYDSSSKSARFPAFQLQAEPTGNNTTSPGGTFKLLYASNSGTPVETGLYFNADGTIHFASGQTFPGGGGSGTITGVTAGTGLTGGGTSGKVTLNIDTTKIPQLKSNNSFTALQTVKTSSSSAAVTIQNSDSSAGIGLEATAYTGIESTGTKYGIRGMTTSGNAGVYGSIQGANTNGGSGYESGNAGVWGDTGGEPGTYIGVLGTANATAGGVFDNDSLGNFYAALFAQNDTSSNPGAAVLATLGTIYDGTCDIDVSGNLTCSGAISGSNVAADRRILRTYALQATENWYEDAGAGQLKGGSAQVALEGNFSAVVNSESDYRVFLTPNGDCKGLYVTHKTAAGFEVRELGGGVSNVAFDYRIMAKRKGFEKLRMEDVTLRQRALTQQRPRIPRRAAGAAVSNTQLKIAASNK